MEAEQENISDKEKNVTHISSNDLPTLQYSVTNSTTQINLVVCAYNYNDCEKGMNYLLKQYKTFSRHKGKYKDKSIG